MITVKPNWKTTREAMQPGEFCGFWRSKELVIGLAAEPVRDGHPPSLLVVHAGASPNLVGKYFNRLDNSYGLLRLLDVEVRFSPGNIRHGDPDNVPSGALILGEDGPCLLARSDDLNEFAVALNHGSVVAADLYRSFWTPRWSLVHAGSDDGAEPIFEFGEAQAGGRV